MSQNKIGDIWLHGKDGPTILTDHGPVLCDGSLLSRKKYPILYGLIGMAYADEDKRCCTAELFPIPDLREKTSAD